jgi:hypothetical protein
MPTRSLKRKRTQEKPHVDGRCTSATQGNQLGLDRCLGNFKIHFSQTREPIAGLQKWQRQRGRCTRVMMTAQCACRLSVTIPVDGMTPQLDHFVACRALNELHPQQPALPDPVVPVLVCPVPVALLDPDFPVDSEDASVALLDSEFPVDSENGSVSFLDSDFPVDFEDDFLALPAQDTLPFPEPDRVPCPLDGCGIGDCYHCFGILGLGTEE